MRIRVLILGAEKFRNGLLNVRDLESPLLIPDYGFPIFNQMVCDDQEVETYFVISKDATLTKNLLHSRYFDNQNVNSIEIPPEHNRRNGPATSLRLALDQLPQHDIPTLVFFGDNVFDFDEVFSQLKVSAASGSSALAFCFEFVDSPKYSFFEISHDSQIIRYITKNSSSLDNQGLKTEVGLYFFGDTLKLRQILSLGNCHEMSDVLNDYQDVRTLQLSYWKDLGHWDLLSNAKQIGSSRSFNSLTFIENTGCLQKSSTNLDKIANEVNFYQKLPEEFVMHFPRLHSANLIDGQYSIEYWPIKSLSEYIVFWNLSSTKLLEAGEKIVARLDLYSHSSGIEHSEKIHSKELYLFYSQKFLHSLDVLKSLHGSILGKSHIQINGQSFFGIPNLLVDFLNQLERFCDFPIPGFLHGDLCFSNVLYSPEEGLMKFIDPRGSFMKFTNFGDIRYDIAKIFQGLGGYYDFIKAGFYSISQIGESHWEFKIFADKEFVKSIPCMEDVILKRFTGLDVADIYQLVALNLISLLPIHSDNESDQLAFILISIMLLNSVSATQLVEYRL